MKVHLFFVNFRGFRITMETNLWACGGVGRRTLYVGGTISWTGVPEWITWRKLNNSIHLPLLPCVWRHLTLLPCLLDPMDHTLKRWFRINLCSINLIIRYSVTALKVKPKCMCVWNRRELQVLTKQWYTMDYLQEALEPRNWIKMKNLGSILNHKSMI